MMALRAVSRTGRQMGMLQLTQIWKTLLTSSLPEPVLKLTCRKAKMLL